MGITFFNHAAGQVSNSKPIPLTQWPHFDLLWVHSGRLRLTLLVDQRVTRGPGEGILIFPDTPFRGEHLGSACRVSVQHFQIEPPRGTPRLLSGLRQQRRGFELVATQQPEQIEEMIERALQLAGLQQTSLVHEMRIAQLVLILGELRLQQENVRVSHHDRLQAVVEEVLQNPAMHRTLEDMANRSRLSVSHFRALFKQRTGQTPGQFQLRASMHEAARLLRATDLPIKLIARRMNFEQLPHFYRRFVSVYGVTPGSYRRSQTQWV